MSVSYYLVKAYSSREQGSRCALGITYSRVGVVLDLVVELELVDAQNTRLLLVLLAVLDHQVLLVLAGLDLVQRRLELRDLLLLLLLALSLLHLQEIVLHLLV